LAPGEAERPGEREITAPAADRGQLGRFQRNHGDGCKGGASRVGLLLIVLVAIGGLLLANVVVPGRIAAGTPTALILPAG